MATTERWAALGLAAALVLLAQPAAVTLSHPAPLGAQGEEQPRTDCQVPTESLDRTGAQPVQDAIEDVEDELEDEVCEASARIPTIDRPDLKPNLDGTPSLR